MRFIDHFTSQLELFSIGEESETGRKYLSFPVNNGLVEYEEYYYISDSQYIQAMEGLSAIREFAKKCKRHEHDELLAIEPGSRRGEPVGGA